MRARPAPPALSPLRRLAILLPAWGALALSQPGLVARDGLGWLAPLGLVPWCLATSRPGRRAFLVEWLAAALGLIGLFAWMGRLLPGILPLMGLIPGFWIALAGILARRLARMLPLALAAPLAWMAGELVRWHLPAPFSFGWWRLGVAAVDLGPLLGAARVVGVFGLSAVLAAAAGGLAALARERRLSAATAVFGFAPPALALLAGLASEPPATRDGPRLLIVQPGIEQRLKAFTEDPFRELFVDNASLTHAALAESERAGEPPPDLVCWGETMLIAPLIEPGVIEGVQQGRLRSPAWTGQDFSLGTLRDDDRLQRALVRGVLFGERRELGPIEPALADLEGVAWAAVVVEGGSILPEGSAFLSGVEEVVAHGAEVRRRNAVALWDPRRARPSTAAKFHLVPGAEDPKGFQRFDWVLDLMRAVGGYVPDFLPAAETGVLELAGASGETWRFGVSVCYDNAFDDPFVRPLRRGGLDFHLVVSNEAWYGRSPEMDHMIAFSRLQAVATGRAVVRATNSGVSAVIAPNGRLTAVLEEDGRRKMARGTLSARVPVPALEATAPPPLTFYVRTAPWQNAFGWALALGSVALAGLVGNRGRERG